MEATCDQLRWCRPVWSAAWQPRCKVWQRRRLKREGMLALHQQLPQVHFAARRAGRKGKGCSRTVRATAAVVSTASPSAASATLLGYLVLLGSTFRSVPQIVRIVRNKSAEGLTLLAFVSELVAYSITWSYNFFLGYPFSSYGEIVCCWLQDVVLIAVILNVRRQLMDLKVLAGSLAFAIVFWLLMTNAFGWQVLTALQASTIAIIALGGRVPQIVMNMQRGNSGELSVLTTGLNVIGCVIRVFTTLVLTQDPLILWGSIIQGVLNIMLFYQTLRTALYPGKAVAVEVGAMPT